MGKNTRSSGSASRQEDVDSKMADLEAKFQQGLQNLRAEYQRSKSNDTDPNSDSFDIKLKKFEAEITNSMMAIKKEIQEIKKEMEDNRKAEERKQRASNLNKLVIRELPERDGANLIQDVCDLIAGKVKVNITKTDINSCYRLGKNDNKGKRCRPVVVQFTCQWKRDEVFFAKKNLKGCEFVICELLTKSRYGLLLKAKRQFGARDVWTARGNVFINFRNKKVPINSEEDLLQLQEDN